MTYGKIKWLILVIPTLTIGIWEYVRHTCLLPYISMELGNYLSPVIVFAVTVTFLRKLFAVMEGIQEELKKERAVKAAMEERERIARELHDGIAQSLFMLSVKVNRLERPEAMEDRERPSVYLEIRRSVHQVNDYVRQAIASLRYPPDAARLPWMESVERLVADTAADTGLQIELHWFLPERRLSSRDKVELYSILREALNNVRKHAEADRVQVIGREEDGGWLFFIKDNGRGYEGDPFGHEDQFGLQIMKRRALEMGWTLQLLREEDSTILTVRKKVAP